MKTMKYKILFRKQRKHYLNRLKKRKGIHLFFLLSKFVGIKRGYVSDVEVYRFKRNVFFVVNGKLQTFIKTKK